MNPAEFLSEHPGDILEFVLLAGNSFTDLRIRRINFRFSCICAFCGVLLCISAGKNPLAVSCALIPGIFMTAAGIFAKEQIGLGDGLVILISGLFLTLPEVLSVCAAASLFSLIPAGILFLRRNKNAKIPFVPFLLAGYVLVWCLNNI